MVGRGAVGPRSPSSRHAVPMQPLTCMPRRKAARVTGLAHTYSPAKLELLHVYMCGRCRVQIDRDLLRIFIRGAPNLLFPAFGLQKQMQERIFG